MRTIMAFALGALLGYALYQPPKVYAVLDADYNIVDVMVSERSTCKILITDACPPVWPDHQADLALSILDTLPKGYCSGLYDY